MVAAASVTTRPRASGVSVAETQATLPVANLDPFKATLSWTDSEQEFGQSNFLRFEPDNDLVKLNAKDDWDAIVFYMRKEDLAQTSETNKDNKGSKAKKPAFRARTFVYGQGQSGNAKWRKVPLQIATPGLAPLFAQKINSPILSGETEQEHQTQDRDKQLPDCFSFGEGLNDPVKPLLRDDMNQANANMKNISNSASGEQKVEEKANEKSIEIIDDNEHTKDDNDASSEKSREIKLDRTQTLKALTYLKKVTEMRKKKMRSFRHAKPELAKIPENACPPIKEEEESAKQKEESAKQEEEEEDTEVLATDQDDNESIEVAKKSSSYQDGHLALLDHACGLRGFCTEPSVQLREPQAPQAAQEPQEEDKEEDQEITFESRDDEPTSTGAPVASVEYNASFHDGSVLTYPTMLSPKEARKKAPEPPKESMRSAMLRLMKNKGRAQTTTAAEESGKSGSNKPEEEQREDPSPVPKSGFHGSGSKELNGKEGTLGKSSSSNGLPVEVSYSKASHDNDSHHDPKQDGEPFLARMLSASTKKSTDEDEPPKKSKSADSDSNEIKVKKSKDKSPPHATDAFSVGVSYMARRLSSRFNASQRFKKYTPANEESEIVETITVKSNVSADAISTVQSVTKHPDVAISSKNSAVETTHLDKSQSMKDTPLSFDESKVLQRVARDHKDGSAVEDLKPSRKKSSRKKLAQKNSAPCPLQQTSPTKQNVIVEVSTEVGGRAQFEEIEVTPSKESDSSKSHGKGKPRTPAQFFGKASDFKKVLSLARRKIPVVYDDDVVETPKPTGHGMKIPAFLSKRPPGIITNYDGDEMESTAVFDPENSLILLDPADSEAAVEASVDLENWTAFTGAAAEQSRPMCGCAPENDTRDKTRTWPKKSARGPASPFSQSSTMPLSPRSNVVKGILSDTVLLAGSSCAMSVELDNGALSYGDSFTERDGFHNGCGLFGGSDDYLFGADHRDEDIDDDDEIITIGASGSEGNETVEVSKHRMGGPGTVDGASQDSNEKSLKANEPFYRNRTFGALLNMARAPRSSLPRRIKSDPPAHSADVFIDDAGTAPGLETTLQHQQLLPPPPPLTPSPRRRSSHRRKKSKKKRAAVRPTDERSVDSDVPPPPPPPPSAPSRRRSSRKAKAIKQKKQNRSKPHTTPLFDDNSRYNRGSNNRYNNARSTDQSECTNESASVDSRFSRWYNSRIPTKLPGSQRIFPSTSEQARYYQNNNKYRRQVYLNGGHDNDDDSVPSIYTKESPTSNDGNNREVRVIEDAILI